MGKLKFPKEKPGIAQKLNEARKLIESSREDAQTLLNAYRVISECAEAGSPRAAFMQACFLYVDETEAGNHREDILPLLEAAEKKKYPLAGDFRIDYLLRLNEPELLFAAVRKAKVGSPQALYCEGGYLSGYLGAPKGGKTNPVKACECFEKSARLFLEREEACRRGSNELADLTVMFRNPYYFSVQAGYSYQMEMFVCSDLDRKENLQRYKIAYENAQKYGNPLVKYKTAAVRVTDCMNNVMGMHSLKTVNALLGTVKTAFAALDDDERESLKENYDSLWKQYDEFYDDEIERLRELGKIEVYTSADYARQDSLISDFASAVQRWSESRPQKTEYTVTVDNKAYKLNDLGEMVDEYGQSNGLRVDVTSKKVYDSHSDAVGYFDSFGEFHKY